MGSRRQETLENRTSGTPFPILYQDTSLYEFFYNQGTSVEDDLGLDLRLQLSGDSLLTASLCLNCFSDTWCMMYDPAGLAVSWLRRELNNGVRPKYPSELSSVKGGDLRVLKYSSSSLRSDFKLALSLGSIVALTEVTDHAWSDPVILSLLERRTGKTSQGEPALLLGGELVEWHPSFNLILVCETPVAVPDSLDETIFLVSLSPTLR
jgi:hypothetical protein